LKSLRFGKKRLNLPTLVYDLTKSFPDHERFGLTNQMRRAAVSVSSNVAEGSSRSSRTDFARFIEIAAGSLFEVVSQAAIAKRQGFTNDASHKRLIMTAEKQIKMLSGLRKSLLKRQE
jgi:four helix bundle protein